MPPFQAEIPDIEVVETNHGAMIVIWWASDNRVNGHFVTKTLIEIPSAQINLLSNVLEQVVKDLRDIEPF